MKRDEIDALDFSGWPLPDEPLIELGRLAVMWSTLEGALDMYLGKLAGFNDLSDPRPFVLLKHSSFPQKLDSLSAICGLLAVDHPNLSEHKAVVAQLRTAQSGRNRFLHNPLGADPENGSLTIARGQARGKLDAKVEEVHLADIKRVTMDIHEAMLALHALVTGHKVVPRWHRDADV